MAELNWTAEAERWLRDIYDFIAKDNPTAAIRTVQSIYDKPSCYVSFLRRAIAFICAQIDTLGSSCTGIIELHT